MDERLVYRDDTESVRVQLRCRGCGQEFDIPLSTDPRFAVGAWELCPACQRGGGR